MKFEPKAIAPEDVSKAIDAVQVPTPPATAEAPIPEVWTCPNCSKQTTSANNFGHRCKGAGITTAQQMISQEKAGAEMMRAVIAKGLAEGATLIGDELIYPKATHLEERAEPTPSAHSQTATEARKP